MKDLKKEEKILEDPSQIYRPDVPDYEEKTKDFRNYGEDNALFDRVKKTYLDMHTNQTVEYVQAMHKKVNCTSMMTILEPPCYPSILLSINNNLHLVA